MQTQKEPIVQFDLCKLVLALQDQHRPCNAALGSTKSIALDGSSDRIFCSDQGPHDVNFCHTLCTSHGLLCTNSDRQRGTELSEQTACDIKATVALSTTPQATTATFESLKTGKAPKAASDAHAFRYLVWLDRMTLLEIREASNLPFSSYA